MFTDLPTDDRKLELLALRAVEGLDPEGERELGPDSACEDLDWAAAVLAIGLAAGEGLDDMPGSLRGRLNTLADDFVAEAGSAPTIAGRIEPKPQTTSRSVEAPTQGVGVVGLLGWIAAAACLAFAVVSVTPERTPTAVEALASLEARAGVINTAWVGLDDAALSESPHQYDVELTGKVVWDDETNEGFMVFEGLAENDPETFQYQLWIFDAERPTGQLPQFGEGILSQRPVDGGVFDSDGSGQVIVPIDPKLAVGKAAVFAITVEPPGGVVVSDRDIVTLALVN